MFFAAGMSLFGILFLLLFIPFNISEWIIYTSPVKRLQLPMLCILCAAILFSSQSIQYLIFKGKNELKIYHFFFGFVFDVLFATLPLSYLYSIPANSYWIEFIQTLKIVALIIALCYLIAALILAIIQMRKEKEEIVSIKNIKKEGLDLQRLNIRDEHGQLRLSVKPEDLLYFESADNYVITYYRKDQRIAKELIRTSLKNIEAELAEQNCVRCHRSFMVNLQNVSSIKKRGRTYEISITGIQTPIPISRGYVKIIKDLLV
jgi:DNA-binding LytR/AlgR family response regulator